MESSLDSGTKFQDARRQTRRAWLVLSAGLLVFAVIVLVVAVLANFYFRHATRPETATLSIISGSGALIRSPGTDDWRLITGTTQVSEGDTLSTTLGTVLWITLFDGSTVEVAEDTVLTVSRIRVSRFFDSTKNVVLTPERGTVYIAMAPRGDYSYSEFTVRTPTSELTMADGNGARGVGSFLVEVQPLDPAAPPEFQEEWTRAAVLRGAAQLRTPNAEVHLHGNEQVRVAADGSIGPFTKAVRQLIADGSFEYGLSNWVEFHDVGADDTAPTTAGSVELVNDWMNGDRVVAVEFLRGTEDQISARTGVRQRIGQTLRVYSSVQLEFDLKIAAQQPHGGGAQLSEFPLVVELNYVDVLGEERQWSRRFYAIDNPDVPVPIDSGSRVDLNTWEHVIFDLRNLSPLPRQITSLVVYASGRNYQTMVTNLSLTSSELGQSDL